ncbi:hypothetical protein [Maricaulis sp.]|uniref:hypothetical protein n=1 Tax=Maricaulis sp. TaxID=1486257 RepID=UPI003A92A3DA
MALSRNALVGGLALASLAGSEVFACSVLPDNRSYSEHLADRRGPLFAQWVRSAAFIEIAIPVSATPMVDGVPLRHGAEHEYTFTVVERLVGDGPSTYQLLLSSSEFALGPDDSGDMQPEYWVERYRSEAEAVRDHLWDWDAGRLPDIGLQLYGAGDCSSVIEFVIGTPLLVLRSASGVAMGTVPLFESNEPWLTAVRYLLANPEAAYGRHMSLEEYLRRQNAATVYEVTDCTLPLLTRRRVMGDVSEWEIEHDEVISGPPSALESYLIQTEARFRSYWNFSESSLAEGLEYAAEMWADVDSARFSEFPFDSDTCHPTARYVRTSWGTYFPIANGGDVDFSGYASQVEITGPLTASLADVIRWTTEGVQE